MYKGDHISGIKFYNLLFESREFTSEMGKVALASGKLEAELIIYLKRKGIHQNIENYNLGLLIRTAEQSGLLTHNQLEIYKLVKNQRNYLTHNFYALFADLKEETVLPKNNLLDSDVLTYIECALQLRENLDSLSENLKNS